MSEIGEIELKIEQLLMNDEPLFTKTGEVYHIIGEIIKLGGKYNEYKSNTSHYISVVLLSEFYVYVITRSHIIFAEFIFGNKAVICDYSSEDMYTFYNIGNDAKTDILLDKTTHFTNINKVMLTKGIVGISRNEYMVNLRFSKVKSARK